MAGVRRGLHGPAWPAAFAVWTTAAFAAATAHADGAPAADAGEAHALAEARSVAASSNRFGFDLYQQVRTRSGNLAISPVVTELALAMTAARTWHGGTFTHLERMLHERKLGSVEGDCRPPYPKDDSPPPKKMPPPSLPRVVFDQTSSSNLLDGGFRGEDIEVEIDVQAEATTEAMRAAFHQWSVQDHESDGFRPGAVPFGMTMTLRGRLPFDERHEGTEAFNASTPTQIHPQVVVGWVRVPYARMDGAALVDLPVGRGSSMLIVLPETLDQLAAVERKLPDQYDCWLEALRTRPVDLTLPHWIAWRGGPGDLTVPLSALGVLAPPSTRPAGASQPCRLGVAINSLSDAFDVDRPQAPALAPGDAPTPPVTVVVGHTFLYVIRDVRTGLVTLIGRMAYPSSGRNRYETRGPLREGSLHKALG